MFDRVPMSLAAVGLAIAVPAAAQIAPAPTPAPVAVPAPIPAQAFPTGAEVLSVDGEPLGVLALVETRPGGERILHIRRTDGAMTTAPAVMASRGERAIVLEWTRAEFESAAPVSSPDSPPSPRM